MKKLIDKIPKAIAILSLCIASWILVIAISIFIENAIRGIIIPIQKLNGMS